MAEVAEKKPLADKPLPEDRPNKAAIFKQYPPPDVDRRTFLMSWAGVAWASFAGAAGAGTLAMARFMFPNVLFEPPSVYKLGRAEEFAEEKVYEQYKSKGFWVVHQRGRLFVLSTTCTHLGCVPNWLGNEDKFKCPCHGSGFRKTGINFEGPAPRPLERFKVKKVEGQVIVDKSKKFQQEKGEWEHPDSFLQTV